MVDWSSGKIYLPNAVHTALLQGDWLAGHVKSGMVTVLAGGQELEQINEAEERQQISILKCPRFWRSTATNANSWTNSFKGRVQWGYLYKTDCDICKSKNFCNDICKHRAQCKLYSFVNDEGDEVLKVKRTNVNASCQYVVLRGQQGMTWLQHKLQ